MRAPGAIFQCALCWLALPAGMAVAQPERYRWVGIWLHPEEANNSYAWAVDGDLPSGKASVNGVDAAIWPEWTTEYVNLTPEGAASATVEGADGGYQAGYVIVSAQEAYSALWNGSAESVIDLTPDGPYLGASLFARRGSQTVGYAYHITGNLHAAMWLNNDPDQFVDLHPPTTDWSEASATDGVWQGGRAVDPGIGLKAALWKGTPESFVSMGPADYLDGWIRGMAPGTQVGTYTDMTRVAVLWHDTPESWVRMSPSWATSAALYATIGDMHVGYASHPTRGGGAGIWYGDDPESFFDLHKFVPPEYADNGSTALDIDTKDGVIYISGTVNTPVAHAFMWVGVPLDEDGSDGQGPKTPETASKVPKP